jgi:hypothetical protein
MAVKKIQLVDNARQWHRWWSMRWIILTVVVASVAPAYAALPADWLPEIPGWLKAGFAYATIVTAAAAGVSRVVKQAPPACPTENEPGEGE